MAVNIWFTHAKAHQPENCVIPEEEATINKYRFSELEKTSGQLNKGLYDQEGKEGEVPGEDEQPSLA